MTKTFQVISESGILKILVSCFKKNLTLKIAHLNGPIKKPFQSQETNERRYTFCVKLVNTYNLKLILLQS